ncbi:MAG: 4-coumarate--CoA ligase [Candidatus Adiutrix sp.]|jgi:4-coumarate--CoA ligase (photoactive yellow protein activation family)|nr:4-coumarate--CoA ligase [Candidatus Adiutrix sp.]
MSLDLDRASALLSEDDFLQLVHSGIWSFYSRLKGLPPSIPDWQNSAELRLPTLLDTAESIPALHRNLAGFFGLEAPPPPAELTLADYARELRQRWLAGRRQVIFHSSGSTGEPQTHPSSEAFLRQEISETAQLFGHLNRVVATVPLMHSFGLVFGLLMPGRLKIPAVSVAPLPSVVMAALRPGDLLLIFPLLLSRLSASPPEGVSLLSSTAPCPEALFQEMTSRGFQSMTEIYGASETGAVGWRKTPGPFQLLGHWRKADDLNLERTNPEGGRLLQPLPDRLRWYGPRHFLPLGRLDMAVQVAGVNVYPRRVAALIQEHPQVLEAAVRPMKPGEGERLKAFVAPRPGADEHILRQELNELFQKRLSPPERPGSLRFGAEIPRTVAGKLRDWKIR